MEPLCSPAARRALANGSGHDKSSSPALSEFLPFVAFGVLVPLATGVPFMDAVPFGRVLGVTFTLPLAAPFTWRLVAVPLRNLSGVSSACSFSLPFREGVVAGVDFGVERGRGNLPAVLELLASGSSSTLEVVTAPREDKLDGDARVLRAMRRGVPLTEGDFALPGTTGAEACRSLLNPETGDGLRDVMATRRAVSPSEIVRFASNGTNCNPTDACTISTRMW